MSHIENSINSNLKYLQLLARQYPTLQSVYTEIINLRAILNLPKATEHFMSDLHGEYEAFTHILNNGSGVIREKVDGLYSGTLSEQERAQLCTLIYYPREKLSLIKQETPDMNGWYESALLRLIDICKDISSKYSRSKVRKALPKDFTYIIDELLHADYDEVNQSLYYGKIMESILSLGNADDFIEALSTLIKRLSVDRLHIVGDIFDRGPRPDLIMDMLMSHHSVDVQWGNHDILWMGAAAGNPACIATVVNLCASFGNFKVLEQGYGINLRPLAMFAEKTYNYNPRFASGVESENPVDQKLAGKIQKAIAIILFKLEGNIIKSHPEYDMDDRLLLDKIDLERQTVRIGDSEYPITDAHFPTLNPDDAYLLSEEEASLVDGLVASFLRSERLQRHVGFLYSNGGMYSRYNQNLMYHGCIPMNENGNFKIVELDGEKLYGKALMDRADALARQIYRKANKYYHRISDHMWYMWCGKNSPLFGRDKMTTFERLFIEDQSTWTETKDSYYRLISDEAICQKILEEFGLANDISHIINGHVPVLAVDGENPIKGGGKLVVIDGGFCKAYQPKTGIAGYTLIYNSYGLRLSAHKPFESIEDAVANNVDIHSSTMVFERMQHRMKVMDTDIGNEISENIYDLSLLLEAYRGGYIKPSPYKN